MMNSPSNPASPSSPLPCSESCSADPAAGPVETRLQDLFFAEMQLLKVRPKMTEAANNPKLKADFIDHVGQTKERVK